MRTRARSRRKRKPESSRARLKPPCPIHRRLVGLALLGSAVTQRLAASPATLIITARGIRSFGDGLISLVLPVYLLELGYSALATGDDCHCNPVGFRHTYAARRRQCWSSPRENTSLRCSRPNDAYRRGLRHHWQFFGRWS